MSSKDYVVLIGKKRQISLRRQLKEGQEALETKEQHFPWVSKQTNSQIETPDQLHKRKKRRKTKHHVSNKSVGKSIQPKNTLTDSQSDKDFCNATERRETDICITGAFSLADVRTKTDAEAFVETLKSRLKEPKLGRKIDRVHSAAEHKELEIEKLRRKIAKLQKRNIELETTSHNLHRLLKEVLSCQVNEKADTASRSISPQKNQQRKERLENGNPRQLEIGDCRYTNDGKICSVRPNHAPPDAIEGSPSYSGIVVYSHANVPVLNNDKQAALDENNNSETQMKVCMPVTKPPIFYPIVGDEPAPPSYEVALNIYPPSDPWKHLQHVLQPNETHLKTSRQNVIHDYQASVPTDYRSEISQPPGNTNSALSKLSNQTPCLSSKSHLEVNASSQTMPNSYGDARKSDTKTQSTREHSAPKRNLKKQNIAVCSFETPCGTNELSLSTKEKSKKNILRKRLLRNKKKPDTSVPSNSISCSCNDVLNDKMSVTPNSVVGTKEKNIWAELSKAQGTHKENLNDSASVSETLLTGNRNIPTSVNICYCPNNTCEKNCAGGDDSGVARCESPEFPPPSKDMLKTTAGLYKHKRKHSLQLYSHVKEEVTEM